jgi:hypothetical protein
MFSLCLKDTESDQHILVCLSRNVIAKQNEIQDFNRYDVVLIPPVTHLNVNFLIKESFFTIELSNW